MCRYALAGPYRDHYACFRCRKSFKWPHDRHATRTETLPDPKCPQCAGPVEAMGLDFKAPPQKAVDQWKKVRILADHGIRYSSCGCGGPGFRPAELRDVYEAPVIDRHRAVVGRAVDRRCTLARSHEVETW